MSSSLSEHIYSKVNPILANVQEIWPPGFSVWHQPWWVGWGGGLRFCWGPYGIRRWKGLLIWSLPPKPSTPACRQRWASWFTKELLWIKQTGRQLERRWRKPKSEEHVTLAMAHYRSYTVAGMAVIFFSSARQHCVSEIMPSCSLLGA